MNTNMNRMSYFNLDYPPPFSGETLKKWDDLDFINLKQYVIEEQRYGCASVNVFRVVGTQHPDYAEKTWLDLLNNGKRMQLNLPLFQDNPDYYLETAPKKPFMHYVSLDGGDVYIGDEGNHRTCIAKFFFFTQGLTTLHGITLQDYRIDWTFKALCDELKATVEALKIPIYLNIQKKLIERKDAADWKLDRFSLTARLFDARCGETHLVDHDGLVHFIDKLRKPWWKFW